MIPYDGCSPRFCHIDDLGRTLTITTGTGRTWTCSFHTTWPTAPYTRASAIPGAQRRARGRELALRRRTDSIYLESKRFAGPDYESPEPGNPDCSQLLRNKIARFATVRINVVRQNSMVGTLKRLESEHDLTIVTMQAFIEMASKLPVARQDRDIT